MVAIFDWLQHMLGSEARAGVAAFLACLAVSTVLGVGLFHGLAWLSLRLVSWKDVCPTCRRRSLAVCWCDETDEDGTEYSYSRCDDCGARYRVRYHGEWEDASAATFDAKYEQDGNR